MKNYKIIRLIKNSLKKKYHNTLYPNKIFKKLFQIKLEIINSYGSQLRLMKEKNKLKKNKFTIELYLKNLINKDYLNNNEKLKLLLIYKKFSVHLRILHEYNSDFLSISKKETSLNSYIYLAYLIDKIPNINELQKLNFLIKLNEKVLIRYSLLKNKTLKQIYAHNLKNEIKLIKNYIQ
tara:strand:+ start:27 stop:563 length:537 start_codon:yes stop_codon:yes gene_type:complete